MPEPKECRCLCLDRHPGVTCAEKAQPGRYGGFQDPAGALYFAKLCQNCADWWKDRNLAGKR